jgi:hypothetical protein
MSKAVVKVGPEMEKAPGFPAPFHLVSRRPNQLVQPLAATNILE